MARYYDDDELAGEDIDDVLAGDYDEELSGPPRKQQRPAGPQKARYHLCAGIPVMTIPAGSTGTPVHVDFSESMAPKFLGFSTAAQALRLVNFVVGTKNMNVNGQPIPCNLFSEQSQISAIIGFTAQRGVGVDLSFANPTAAPIDVSGAFFGPTGAA